MNFTKKIVWIFGLFVMTSFTSFSQEKTIEDVEVLDENGTLTATFDNYHETYNFTAKIENNEDVYAFDSLSKDVEKQYNLKDKKFSGKIFEITYVTETKKEKDDDGDEQEYNIKKITSLKLLI